MLPHNHPANTPIRDFDLPSLDQCTISPQLLEDLPHARIIARALLVRTPHELSELLTSISPEDKKSILVALQTLGLLGKQFSTTLQNHGHDYSVENERQAKLFEPSRIQLDRVLVLGKRSMVELDKFNFFRQTGKQLSDLELSQLYQEIHIDVNGAFTCHEMQCKARAELRQILGTDHFYNVWDLQEQGSLEKVINNEDWDLVIALGGDETIKTVCSYVKNQFVLPLNSDSATSVGANALYSRAKFGEVLNKLSSGQFHVQEWARLSTTLVHPRGPEEFIQVDHLPPAMNEVVLADENGFMTFRGEFQLETFHNSEWKIKRKDHVKGSGCLIAVGAGSTGWYSSVSEAYYPFGRIWPRTKQHAEFIAREPYRYDLFSDPNNVTSMLNDPHSNLRSIPWSLNTNDRLRIRSTSKNSPMITIDGVKHYPFPCGSQATIALSDHPLKVVVAR